MTSVLGAAIVVAVGSPLIMLFAWLQVRRALELATNGVCVKATITSVGRLRKAGMVPVRYSYSFDGKIYEMAEDMLKKDAILGRETDLMVDPKNPKKAMRFNSVFPSAPQKE